MTVLSRFLAPNAGTDFLLLCVHVIQSTTGIDLSVINYGGNQNIGVWEKVSIITDKIIGVSQILGHVPGSSPMQSTLNPRFNQ